MSNNTLKFVLVSIVAVLIGGLVGWGANSYFNHDEKYYTKCVDNNENKVTETSKSENQIVRVTVNSLLSRNEIMQNFKNISKESNGLKLTYNCTNNTTDEIRSNYKGACAFYNVKVNNLFSINDLTTEAFGGTGSVANVIKTNNYYIVTKKSAETFVMNIYDLNGKSTFIENNGYGDPVFYKDVVIFMTYDDNNKVYYEYLELSSNVLKKNTIGQAKM